MEEIGLLKAGDIYAGRYRVLMQIGKGGMGRVYLAEDMRLNGKTVALKLTKPLPEERDSFLSEAKLMCGLAHSNLPAIVDYYPPGANGLACIVMDYIAGDTLAERFERFGLRLPFRMLLRYLLQLCEVLAYLHQQCPPIVFRDLKPSNVLIDRRDQAVLVDFGIARRYREGESSDTLQLGTPGFAAPEQLRNEQSDARTDLYALGALAYFLLTGGRFAMRHKGALKSALQGDVPSAFAALLERMLDADPEARPQSAVQLREELLRTMADEGVRVQQYTSLDKGINDYKDEDAGVTVVAIASAYPGAGATFAALAASASLNRAGIAHALVECPSAADAEMYALLDGNKNMPKKAVFADATGLRPTTPAWREGSAHYYPCDPDRPANPEPIGDAFALWLRRLGVPIVLLDVSSRWTANDQQQWLNHAVDRIWMVVDCFPGKWSKSKQEACVSLQLNRRPDGIRVSLDWVANRDQPFSGRKAWLELFPTRPSASLPQVASQAMLASLWQGRGLPDDKLTAHSIDAALENLLVSLIENKPSR
ncbi:serine/threonine-protein kinase [Cohnella yongneupensis]|uniref:non-specific serine/threonine protein kinase n=1 Tax=Cohnella yongneupensis TaxID=425006 RepID=A0ABW0R3T6_9BACL